MPPVHAGHAQVEGEVRQGQVSRPLCRLRKHTPRGRRLGVGEVVAVELLPTAYVFLKAVLEYQSGPLSKA